MKSLLGIFFAALGIQLAAAEILWQADFNKKGELDWKKIRVNANDSFVTKDGVLIATCSALGKNVNKGSVYETALPDVDRGALYFEVRPNATNSNSHSYNHLSLMIRFNGRAYASSRRAFRTYRIPAIWGFPRRGAPRASRSYSQARGAYRRWRRPYPLCGRPSSKAPRFPLPR